MTALLVAIGAAFGAPARYLTMQWLRSRTAATAVAGTLLVNVLGSLAIGLLVGGGIEGNASALLATGFCGAFTTFSTFGLELWQAWTEGERRHAMTNAVLSLVLGLGAAWLGWMIAA